MGFCGSKTNAMSVEEGVIQNECFVDVLNIIPHAILQLVCIFILTVWNHSVIGKLKVKTWVHYQGHDMRWVGTISLLIVIAMEIVEGIISDVNDSDDSTNYHAFVPPCMAFVGTVLSIIFYHNVEMWNSPKFLLVLLFYWPLAVILKCLKALSMYRNDLVWSHLKVWLVIADIALYIILLLVELNVLRCQRYSFFKKSRRKRPPADLENTRFLQPYVNFLSRIVYWWVNDLLIKGFKHPLHLKDLGKLPHTEKSSKLYKKMQMIFEEEKFKASQSNSEPSLAKVFFKASWPMMFVAGILKLFGDLFSFVGPLLIEEIINYAYDFQDTVTASTPPVNSSSILASSSSNVTVVKTHTYIKVDKFFRNGYVLAVVLLICTLLHYSFLQNHFFLVIREGVRIRTAVQTMVFSKVLRLSTLVLSSGSATQGQIMNHMSIDSTFVMYLFFFVHYVWAIPLQVAITLILMYYKLGVSALIGGTCVMLAAPAMYLLGVLMSRLQKKILVESDKRVKKINEVIQGIKVIKLLSWERGFFNSILTTRCRELHHLWPTVICRAFVGFLGIASPVIGTLMTFVLYPVFESKPLSAGAAMSVLALLNLLQGPLQIMTILSATIANARVSSKRLLPFLLAEEVGKTHDSLHSFSKSCSIGFDSVGASGHATVDKLDSLASIEGKLPAIELQSLENKSCLSSSNISIKMPLTPTHSRHGSGDLTNKVGTNTNTTCARSLGHVGSLLSDNANSFELLDVKFHSNLHRKASAPALGAMDLNAEFRRKRHYSNRSMDEDETALADDSNLLEVQSYLEIQAGCFSWDLHGEEVALRDITIKIPAGKLTIVVGQVGSGKSSLLSAMLGEMTHVSGSIQKTKNCIAYMSQKSWLLNASLKDNILFGKPYVWRKYKRVLAACSLQPDIEALPAGDNTEIGEKGVNLSGGQKQRVSLARALYSESDCVFLDDPLSALDSCVGKHVMEEAILKRLVKRNKTVIMVTNHLQYLSNAYHIIVMSNGHVHFHGKVSDVKKFDPDLYEVWRKAIRESKAAELSQKLEVGDSLAPERKHSGGSQSQLSVPGLQNNLLMQSGRKLSAMSVMTEASNEDYGNDAGGGGHADEEEAALRPALDPFDDKDKGRLVKAEHREVGAVSFWVYLYYFKACSIVMCILTILSQFAYHMLMIATNFWLSTWASDANKFVRNVTKVAAGLPLNATYDSDFERFDNSPYQSTFVYLSMSAVVAILLGCLIAYHTGYVGSKNIFLQLLGSVMHLPMRFFDTNPSGRVMNRFSSDINNIDQRIASNLEQFLRCMFFTMSAVAVNCIISPYFTFGALPFFILYYGIQRFFRSTSRELQRLDNVTKSFVFSHLSETIEGIETIRAYGVQTEFKRKVFKAIDSNVTPFLFIQVTNRWLGIRLDFMSSLLVFIAAIASLSAASMSSPALVGLCIAYALMVAGQLNWIVRTSAEVEMSMNAVERMMEYTDEPMEPSIVGSEEPISVPDSWPSVGHIEFQSVTLSYDIELEPVLHNASFVINGGEKIGVCGRTGSGKSSTILALFRLLDIMDGTILVDGLDISQIELVRLRSRLAIIPQDPVLFHESVRFNLDPNGHHSDDKIWCALDKVQMRDAITSLPGQLDAEVAEKGDNLSMGQKQLICLARAFLRESKVIVMDEATASIDPVTDTRIQDIIHSPALHGRTIITIAHRMSTIMKYDRVLVLEEGELKEFASPAQLLTDENSIFYRLVHSTSDAELK